MTVPDEPRSRRWPTRQPDSRRDQQDVLASGRAPEVAARWRTEHAIQRVRLAALALGFGIVWSLAGLVPDPRFAVPGILAITLLVTDQGLRRARSPRSLAALGWFAFLGDTLAVVLALAHVNENPADPIWSITGLLAIQAATRWRTRGAVLGGLAAALLSGWWATMAYAAEGRVLSVESLVFRGAVMIVLALPVGLLIDQLRREQRRTRELYELSTDVVLVLDDTGVVLNANAATARLLDRPVELLVGCHWQDLLGVKVDLRRLMAVTTAGGHELQELTDGLTGRRRWLELTADRSGDRRLIHLIGRDVTARVRAEQQLRASEQRFRALFEHNSDAVLGLDTFGLVVHANPAAGALFSADEAADPGEAARLLEGRELTTMLPPAAAGGVERHLATVLTGRAESEPLDLRLEHGDRREVQLTLLPSLVDGEVAGAFAIARDVTADRDREAALLFEARHDQLTGLANRSALHEDLEVALAADARTGVLFIDLDGFKEVNDSHGHAAGDAALSTVADRLRAAIRTTDRPYRLAGDEFCVLVTPADTAVLDAVAERVTRSLIEPMGLDGLVLTVGASVGSAFATPGEDAARLLARADAAMYANKPHRRPVAVVDGLHRPA